MNTRLKIICILFGVIYLYFLGDNFVQVAVPAFMKGIKEGISTAERRHNKEDKEEDETYESGNLLDGAVSFYVKSASGILSFPSSLMNLKTGKLIRTEFTAVTAIIDSSKLPFRINFAYNIVLFVFTIPLLFVVVFIPVLIYRVIRSVVKNEIFDLRNIQRIRWISYCLLFIFVAEIYTNFVNMLRARELIQMEGYKIVFHIGDEFYWLLFALVTLMFAEILKMSHTMKEEQELTI